MATVNEEPRAAVRYVQDFSNSSFSQVLPNMPGSYQGNKIKKRVMILHKDAERLPLKIELAKLRKNYELYTSVELDKSWSEQEVRKKLDKSFIKLKGVR